MTNQIKSDVQKLSPGSQVEMFDVDASRYGIGHLYFSPDVSEAGDIVWQGQAYTRYPVAGVEFAKSTTGTIPRPKLQASNILGTLSGLNKLYSDLVGSTVTRHRTLVKYLDKANWIADYLSLPGSAANNVTTPDSGTLDITGKFRLAAYIKPNSWRPAAASTIIGKWTNNGSGLSYIFLYNPNGTLQCNVSSNGTNFTSAASSTTPTVIPNDSLGRWVMVYYNPNDGAGHAVFNFYTSLQDPTTPIASIVWTQMGAANMLVAGPVAPFAGTGNLELGSALAGTSLFFAGKMYSAYVYNDTTIVARFEPFTTVGGVSTLVGSTGETWTMHGTASLEGGLSTSADPTSAYPDEIFTIDRKSYQDDERCEYELSAAFDVEGKKIPKRLILKNMCAWKYRSAECTYAGGAVADDNDVPTADINVDECSLFPSGCKLRFGANAALPFGGFVGASLVLPG